MGEQSEELERVKEENERIKVCCEAGREILREKLKERETQTYRKNILGTPRRVREQNVHEWRREFL